MSIRPFYEKIRHVGVNNVNCFKKKVRNASWDMLDENNIDRAYNKAHTHFQLLYNYALPVRNKK